MFLYQLWTKKQIGFFPPPFSTYSNGEASIPLYASINRALTAVQKTQDGKKYQVAWTQEVEKAKAGDVEVNLYDDSGYSAMKRVLERGDDAASVKPLVTIVVNHPVSTLKIDSDGLFWI